MGTSGRWVKVEGWSAGRAWREPDGHLAFHIRKQVAGKRYEVATGASSLRAALKQLERFEADPDGYRPGGANPADAALLLTNTMAEDFLRWSLTEKGNSRAWVRKQQGALAWWMEHLQGVNLRRTSLVDHVLPPLEGAADRATRTRVLKAFYGWLRKERHLVTAGQDPVFGTLSARPSRPAQWTRSKVIPREHFLLVRDALTSPWRDALIVQAGTGWHTTEVVRFAASGSIEALPQSMQAQHGAAGVLVCPLHKSGAPQRTQVSGDVLKAAKALRGHAARMNREREANKGATRKAAGLASRVGRTKAKAPGAFSREWYDRAVRAACASVKNPDGSAGIPVFTPGRFRHSVATWAIEAGADPAAVSAFLGHKSLATTKRFYATLATVPKVPTLA